MSKRLFLGVLLAVVAIAAAATVWSLRGEDGSGRAQGEAVEMGIDPEVTGNTATTLGTLEYCVRVDIESPAFDNVSDHNIDVYVQGDTLAPVAYDAWVIYDATKVHIAAPGTNTLIKLPGAASFSNAVPDTDGKFVASVGYLSGGPGTAGDGVLVRLGLDIGASGLFTFDFDAPEDASGYYSPGDDQPLVHPVTRMTAVLAINEECPRGGRGAGGGSVPGEGETQLVRWGNVTMEVPADSDIYYARLSSAPQAMARGIMGPVLELGTREAASLVIIDAATGKVVHEDVPPEERAAFDAALATLEVASTDVADAPGAPWPYGPTPPTTPRRSWRNMSYLEPDPASGISVQPLDVDFIEPQPPGSNGAIRVANGRSHMGIDGAGRVFVTAGAGFTEFTLAGFLRADAGALDGIHPDDREAFQRFAQAVEVGPPPEEEEP